MGSITLMHFTDRMFLANYSLDAIAAALPAGIASFTSIAFFMGVANYTNAFVAQYTGARALNRVGAALWQGIYFSLLAALSSPHSTLSLERCSISSGTPQTYAPLR